MFKHILIPVDGSATSAAAVARAIALAKAFDSQVTTIYVIDPYPFTGVGSEVAYGQDQYLTAATEESGKAIDNVKRQFAESGLSVNSAVIEGHALHQSILDEAAKAGADLIVMGSHVRGGLEKLFLGSVTEQVVAHAHVSVLVVREPVAAA